jgi:hypothetical protein
MAYEERLTRFGYHHENTVARMKFEEEEKALQVSGTESWQATGVTKN